MSISPCYMDVSPSGQELTKHGSSAFPAACYHDDLSIAPVPWHWHEELEALIVDEGSVTVGCAETSHTLNTGEGMLINSGVLHGCRQKGDTPCRLHSIVFHPKLVGGSPDSVFYHNYLEPLLRHRIGPCQPLSPDIDWQNTLLQDIEIAWTAVRDGSFGFEFTVRQHLSGMILLLCQKVPIRATGSDLRWAQKDQRAKFLLQYIHDHYQEKITVRDIAVSASISESECLRCFHSIIHVTPSQYLRQYRIQKACELLQNTTETVASVAASCGFEDVSFFIKSFRQAMGVTPAAYRKLPRG